MAVRNTFRLARLFMASVFVRLPILSVLRLAPLKCKNSPALRAQTVCIFTLLFTKNALQNGQKNTPSEAISGLPLIG